MCRESLYTVSELYRPIRTTVCEEQIDVAGIELRKRGIVMKAIGILQKLKERTWPLSLAVDVVMAR